MRREVFLLGKMTREKVDQALELGAEGLFVSHKNLDKELCQELTKKGIRVCSEIGLFAGEEWWQQYPDSRPISRKGKVAKKAEWYAGVCPNHPLVREEKLKEMEKLMGDFSIDGVWLDFIRYPCHWEVSQPDLTEYCFCQNCLEKFKKEVGGEPKGEKWFQWKCAQITNFVAAVRDLIDQKGKQVELGMFVVPWQESEFDGAITRVIGQDFKSLARYIDVFSPMVYHRMCGRPVKWIHEIVVYMNKITGKPALPIIQTEDKPGKISKEKFAEALNCGLKAPSLGVIVFFLEDLLNDEDKLQVVKEKFKT